MHRIGLLCFAIALPALAARAATVVVNDESVDLHDPGCATTGVGVCNLRDAAAFTNSNPGHDWIQFNIPGEGVRSPSCGAIYLTDLAGATVDGFTQPGASPNTLDVGNDAVWKIRCSTGTVGALNGISLYSSNNVVRGLILEGWGVAIDIGGSSDNRVSGNLIRGVPAGNGTGVSIYAAGVTAQRNLVGGVIPADRNVIFATVIGVSIFDIGTSANIVQGNILGPVLPGFSGNSTRGVVLTQTSDNLIGGTAPGARNVISGHISEGIQLNLGCSGNRIEGNSIGTTVDGLAARGNGRGVYFSGADDNWIGGTVAGSGNLISGNGIGIAIAHGADRNRVAGNRIGTNVTGTAAVPNGTGVSLDSNVRDTVIGGTTAGSRNVISGNGRDGLIVSNGATNNLIVGNFIGTDVTGLADLGNGRLNTLPDGAGGVTIFGDSDGNRVGGVSPGEANLIAYNGNTFAGGWGVRVMPGSSTGVAILSNSIHSNFALGIDLDEAGATLNDVLDGDGGPNGQQNFPMLTQVSAGEAGTRIQGDLASSPTSNYTIQFFSSLRCDPDGHGEGELYLGSTAVQSGADGRVSFDVTMPVILAPSRRVSATATDAAGNTSEFSRCFPEANRFHTVSPCRVVDTRDSAGPSGGPALVANTVRRFSVAGLCGIPETAQAVAFNFTSTGSTDAGNLTVYPAGSRIPLASTLNFGSGRSRANNAIIPLGTGGEIAIYASQSFGGTSQVVIDVTGYFE